MLKQAFFALLFVCLWGTGTAYAQSASSAGPSATLKVTVVPPDTNACVVTGQAGQDLMTAGFSTIALCNDFTTPIPNTVGTGLPTNWLDCNHDSSTSYVWYWNFPLFGGSGSQPPCTGYVAWNVTDPVNGNNALRFTLTDAEIATYGFPASGMSTINWNQTNPVPGAGEYPYAYYEYTFRDDITTPGGLTNTLWSWVSSNARNLAGQQNYIVELDFNETYACVGCPITDTGFNQWGPSGKLSFAYLSQNLATSLTSYHTWGVLFTGDGGNNFSVCSYVDGTRSGCSSEAYAAGAGNGENLQRRYLMTWLDNGAAGGSVGTANMYIKSIKVLTCANWQQSSAAGMCPGSKLNSIGFYQ